MGLDMYLEGHVYSKYDREKPEGQRRPTLEGFEIKATIIELGYWSKHPNLHGYIVQNHGGGKDECQEIGLGEEEIVDIIEAIQEKRLPVTKGFFFGESDGSEDEESIKIFERALAWKKKGPWRYISYRASW